MTPASRLPLAVRAGRELRAAGLTISLAEVGTGGAVTSALTDIPGSSAYVIGAVTAPALSGLAAAGYHVSDPDPVTLGGWLRERLASDLGLVVTGMEASGAGFRYEVVVTGPSGVQSRTYQPRGAAADVQPRVARQALRGLLTYLQG